MNFDQLIDRRNTHSAKWDALEAATGVSAPDGLAMWVADMDFQAPDGVRQALLEEVNRSVHGYYAKDDSWRQAIIDWMAKRHDWTVDPAHITATPGIVSACGLLLQAFTTPGDGIVLFTPVYHAFHKIIKANDREIIQAPLVQKQGRYAMDLEALDQTLPANARMVFFCSPHNPGGTVWRPDEIKALADFCAKHDLLLVSDEIHHDLVLPPNKHHVTETVVPEHRDLVITAASASKTFNLASGHLGFVVITDDEMRATFQKTVAAAGLMSHNGFGMLATEAAYKSGEEWLEALLEYLQGNINLLTDRITTDVPGARVMPMEATYLCWVDFAAVNLPMEEIMRRVRDVARIGVNKGPEFGLGGESWLRFNVATPRANVEEAMDRMKEAFADLG